MAKGARLQLGVDARTCLSKKPRGEGRSILRLYAEVAAVRPAWSLHLYANGDVGAVPDSLRDAKIHAFDVPGFRFSSWENWGLPYRSLVDRLDAIHCTSSSAPLWCPAPLAVTVHDVIPLIHDDGLSSAAIEHFRAGLMQATKNAKAVVAVSENTKVDLVRTTKVNPDKVHVIHWGTDPAPQPPSDDRRRELNASVGIHGRYVIAFGGAARRKNTDALIRGFAQLSETLRDVELVLIGLGSARARFGALIDDVGMIGRIHALDYIDDARLEALYAGAAALLYLSTYEGFGLPILEAMSRGVPVIASNVSSMPEVAGDAALLVDPSDARQWGAALIELCRNAALSEEMSERGRRRAREFSWERCALRYIALFEEMVATARSVSVRSEAQRRWQVIRQGIRRK